MKRKIHNASRLPHLKDFVVTQISENQIPAILDIRSPVTKSATAIAAAASANTGVAGDVALSTAKAVAESTQNPEWFWFAMSLPWGQIASMVAALYTLALFSEWMWKKPINFFLVKLGWKKEEVRLTLDQWSQVKKES